MRRLLVALLLFSVAPVDARAQDLFGAQGQIVPGGSISFAYRSRKPPEGDALTRTELTLGPQMLYFVADYIAVGGAVRYRNASSGEGPTEVKESGWTVMPMAAVNIPFVEFMSLFIELGIRYGSSTTEIDGRDGGSHNRLGLDLFVPLLFHPVPNFFIGIGPELSLDLLSKYKPPEGDSTDGSKDMGIGLATLIGGYI